MADIIGGRYQITELLAVAWNPEMTQRFPNADHSECRLDSAGRCTGWHCNRCGKPTNSYGHHQCPDRPVTHG
ncbi:hypothetical protein PJN91_17270 [Mycobacterium kansasii]